MNCKHIFVFGQRKGEQCYKLALEEGYCHDHDEYIKKYRRDYQRANKDKNKVYRDKDKEKFKEYQKGYYKTNWDKKLIRNCRYTDNKKGGVSLVDIEWVHKMQASQGNLCYHCGVELILTNGNRVPQQASINRVDTCLGFFKGNVVLACLGCTYQKKSKTFDEFGSDPIGVLLL